MNKFSKEQKALLESALDKLYTFLEVQFNVKYRGNYMLYIFNTDVEFRQYSLKDRIAWFGSIDLKQRRIFLITNEIERESFHSKHWYSLNYLSTQFETFYINF